MQDAARPSAKQILHPLVPGDLLQPLDPRDYHLDVLRLVRVGARGGLRVASSDPDRLIDAFSIQLRLMGLTRAELFILMTAFDEASSQAVHTRTSYKAREIVFGARYQDIFVASSGKPTIDLSVLSAVKPV